MFKLILIIETYFEIKFPKRCIDGKAEVGKIREEKKRLEKNKNQKKKIYIWEKDRKI